MFCHPDSEAYRDSLAKNGVGGSLQKRFPGVEGDVFAKTGYISGVRALSGYVRTNADEWLVFSIIYWIRSNTMMTCHTPGPISATRPSNRKNAGKQLNTSTNREIRRSTHEPK